MSNLPVEKWQKKYCSAENPKTDFFLDRAEDDSCGWGTVFRELWSLPGEYRPGGIVLTGPEGSGRHNTAANLAGWLADEHQYVVVFLSGAELCCEAENFSEVKERLDAVLNDCYDNGFKPLCMILERPEECLWSTQLADCLGKLLYEYKQMENHPDEELRYPPLFMIFLPEQKWEIPAFLRKQLRVCDLPLPGHNQRLEFLKNHGADELSDYIIINTLAEITDGMNYFQLTDVIETARLVAMSTENGKTSSAILSVESMIRSQVPKLPETAKKEHLEQKLEVFLEELPKALARIRIGMASAPVSTPVSAAVQSFPAAQTDSKTDAIPGTKSAEELEKMRVWDLVSNTFDKDIADSLLANSSQPLYN